MTHKKGAHKRKQFSKHNATSVSLVQACYITASDLNLCSITEQMHITWVLQAQTAFAQKLFQMTFQFNRPQICPLVILSVSQHTFSSPRGASSSWANSRASSTWPLRISSMRRCCCKWKNNWGFVSSICHAPPYCWSIFETEQFQRNGITTSKSPRKRSTQSTNRSQQLAHCIDWICSKHWNKKRDPRIQSGTFREGDDHHMSCQTQMRTETNLWIQVIHFLNGIFHLATLYGFPHCHPIGDCSQIYVCCLLLRKQGIIYFLLDIMTNYDEQIMPHSVWKNLRASQEYQAQCPQ